MSSELKIDYLDYRFTATLATRETGRVAVVDWQLDSVGRGKTFAWTLLDRFLKRNDFAHPEDARANIVEWLDQLGTTRGATPPDMTASPAAAIGGVTRRAEIGAVSAVETDSSVAEVISDVGVEIASDLGWIDMIAEWFTDGPA
ncbi:hypothetical protein KDW55_12595 [Burkholderia sp. AU19243]|uniref:hypothetical protein n=1 Tax=Burkholderia TaxID=32008 RepID=UPI00084185E2|nr:MULTISPECIES: hypothetical protein [Burkholderia]MBR8143022.1 hypothetical protein [Burkholderia vietnamiensis]AOK04371.1 hypothetical protein WK25_07780 [Burkholderia latens]MBR8364170.1 hypothetical protein [Burkholderia sp. AU19243]MCA8309459.1 hypothetical protein [Burkholderia sp. AU28942]QTO49754.1 hypothetical protein J8I86_07505 [Burkholderia latens]